MRIVIAEDQALLRDGLTRLLADQGHEVVAAVADGDALVEAVVAEEPDLAIVDVRLPPGFRDEGIRAAIKARERVPGTSILVLSQYVERTYAVQLLQGDPQGVGYLLKDRVAEVREFLDAVERVAAGGMVLDPEVVSQLIVRRGPFESMTPRERQVLALMAEGRSNAGIAEALVISEGAVEKHVRQIFMKLGLPPSDQDHRRVLAVRTYLQADD